jgi:hypothetical protein
MEVYTQYTAQFSQNFSSYLQSAASTVAASSLFKSSGLSSNYIFPPSSGSGPNSTVQATEIGPWKIQSATHKINGKKVSVWAVEKSSLVVGQGGKGKGKSVERGVELLKKDVSG